LPVKLYSQTFACQVVTPVNLGTAGGYAILSYWFLCPCAPHSYFGIRGRCCTQFKKFSPS